MRFVSAVMDERPVVAEVVDDQVVPVIGFDELGPRTSWEALRGAQRNEDARRPLDEVRLRPLVPNPQKILCVGLNYRSHIAETRRDDSGYPVLFPKFAGSLIGPSDDIVLPPESEQVDYEGELAVVIGRAGRRIAEDDALYHVLGVAAANDVTMRDFQYKTHQWVQGKSWDDTTPIGPALVTLDEVDLDGASISTTLNGTTVQQSDLGKLVFSIPTLISLISTFTALVPGDVILTGTPGGVGFRRDPQLFLQDGDTVSVSIDGVGSITNAVRAE